MRRIQKVLEGYVQVIGEPYIPRAYSAKKFFEDFIRIEDALTRKAGESPQGAAAEESLPGVDAAVRKLSELKWPTGTKADLTRMLNASVRNRRAWRKAVKARIPEWEAVAAGPHRPDGSRQICRALLKLVKYDLGYLLTKPEEFALWWGRKVHEVLSSWNGYKGSNLSPFDWSPACKTLNDWGLKVCCEGNGADFGGILWARFIAGPELEDAKN